MVPALKEGRLEDLQFLLLYQKPEQIKVDLELRDNRWITICLCFISHKKKNGKSVLKPLLVHSLNLVNSISISDQLYFLSYYVVRAKRQCCISNTIDLKSPPLAQQEHFQKANSLTSLLTFLASNCGAICV